MKNVLAIIGCGELGMQIANYALSDNHFKEVVFFDDFNTAGTVNGYKILGKIDGIENAFQEGEFSELFIGIGYNHMQFRKQIFDRFQGIIPFAKIVHTTCYIDKSSIIKQGTFLGPHCIIDKNARIDENVIIHYDTLIAHDSIVNRHTFISAKVAIAGFVSVGEQSILGINCTIIDNISIAAETQIGGGSVVIKSISEKGLYVGNPVRYIR
jgi:sugar O-acyltransferase (sialic acid O-acetyltransferase NeuD family)